MDWESTTKRWIEFESSDLHLNNKNAMMVEEEEKNTYVFDICRSLFSNGDSLCKSWVPNGKCIVCVVYINRGIHRGCTSLIIYFFIG